MQVGRTMRRRGPQAAWRARIAVEALEERLCLSQTVTGFDADGIGFTLTLSGPGRVLVEKFLPANVNGANPPLPVGVQATPGNPDQTILNSLTNIDKITILGATSHSVLTGHVNSPNHEVLFEQLLQDSSSISTGAVHLPGFSLARTNNTPGTGGTSGPAFSEEPMISFPNAIGDLTFDNIQLNDTASNQTLTAGNQTSTATIDLTTAEHKTNVSVQQIDVGPRVLLQINANAAGGALKTFHARSINGHSEVAPAANATTPADPNHVFEGVTQLIVSPIADSELGAQTSPTPNSFGTVEDIRVDTNAHNFQVEAASIKSVTIGSTFSGDLIDMPVSTSSFGGPGTLRAVNLLNNTGGAPDAPALSTAVIHATAEIRGGVRVRDTVQGARISSKVVGDVELGSVLDSVLQTESFFRSVSVRGAIAGSEILAGLVERNPGGTSSTPGQWVQNGKINRLSTGGKITDSVIAASYDPEDDVFGNRDDDPLSGGSITGSFAQQPKSGGPTLIHGYTTDRNGAFSRTGLGAIPNPKTSTTTTTTTASAARKPA